LEQHEVAILEVLGEPCSVDKQGSRGLRQRKGWNKYKCKGHHVNVHT
jgi:hypothetical protein